MTAIAEVLVSDGHTVFLPHRDGMEFRLIHDVLIKRGWNPDVAGHFLHEAIFALDVYQLAVACDAMVWNMNGRVPDEGAVSEAAIAWTLGKPLIAYQDDARSKIAGRMNPLLVGLVDFSMVKRIEEIPAALSAERKHHQGHRIDVERLPGKLKMTLDRGKTLWEALQKERAFSENAVIADCVTSLFAPKA